MSDRIPLPVLGNETPLPEVEYPRRRTRPVRVGNKVIGGTAPILVQSMITEDTRNVEGAVRQIIQLYEAGCEMVRVTAPSIRDAHAIGEIKAELRRRGVDVPLVADVHHQGMEIALEVARHVDKVRINPGLYVFRKRKPGYEYSEEEIAEQKAAIEEQLVPLIRVLKERDIALRIGVNHGSLSDRILVTYGDTPEGMVQSAMEFIEICEKHGFRNIVVSLKASRAPVMIQANRLMVRRMEERGMDYPIHLGVTEAGDGQYARIKSTAGIATLLAEGIGDTIRVSLAEDPVQEIPVCYEILQALGLRRTRTEFIACPGCGRTKFDLPTVLNEVRKATGHLKGLNIAVMGCLPPGEPVVTEHGFLPIEKVSAGCRVLTHEGTFAPVAATQTHDFEGEVVEIHPRGGLPVRLTPNHPVLALSRAGRVAGGRRRWQNIADVAAAGAEPLWYAAGEIDRDAVLLCPVVQGEAPVDRLPEAPALRVDEAFLTVAACYLARGTAAGVPGEVEPLVLTFRTQEAALARKVQGFLCDHGIATSVRERPERNAVEAVVHSAPVAALFASLFGQRDETRRLPGWMLTLPRTQQAALLRVLWQCDASVGVTGDYPRATYVTRSPAFAAAVHQLLMRQGIPATMRRQQPPNRQPAYSLSVTNADGLRRLAELLGRPIPVPEGRRRTARIALDDRFLYLPVRSVRRVPYAGPVHNLEIARAQTYVGGHCLVHNCIVNGPGEMADADYGYVGKGEGLISLYRGRELVKNMIPAERGVEELVALIKADGRWEDPA